MFIIISYIYRLWIIFIYIYIYDMIYAVLGRALPAAQAKAAHVSE